MDRLVLAGKESLDKACCDLYRRDMVKQVRQVE